MHKIINKYPHEDLIVKRTNMFFQREEPKLAQDAVKLKQIPLFS